MRTTKILVTIRRNHPERQTYVAVRSPAQPDEATMMLSLLKMYMPRWPLHSIGIPRRSKAELDRHLR